MDPSAGRSTDPRREATTEFELECLYDDPSEPSELTIFSPEGESMVTEWITADHSAAVALDSVR